MLFRCVTFTNELDYSDTTISFYLRATLLILIKLKLAAYYAHALHLALLRPSSNLRFSVSGLSSFSLSLVTYVRVVLYL